jgi:hypothetical protein
MFTEDQLAERLTARFEAEVDDLHAADDLAGTVRRRHARRTLATRAGLAVALVATVVTSLAVAEGGPGGRHAPPAASAPGLAFVAQQTRTALAEATEYILETTADGPKGHSVDRTDLRTGQGRFDIGGATPIESHGVPADQSALLIVDYRQRTWTRYQISAGERIQSLPYTEPADIAAAIDDGTLELVGTEQVDGRRMLHLRVKDATQFPLIPDFDLWVDAETYLPYRLTSDASGSRYTYLYRWLPRTPENLATLDLPIPAGFTERPPR